MSDWLPELVLLEHVDGIWHRYVELVYSFFHNDFIIDRVNYKGTRIALRKHPITNGKERTFWHLVSNGEIEDDRLPAINRCERIRWPKPIIQVTDSEDIYIWQNERQSEKRILLYVHEERYLVVLGIRSGYLLLCTAYCVEQDHRHEKLIKEYEAFKKARASSCEETPNTPSTPGR